MVMDMHSPQVGSMNLQGVASVSSRVGGIDADTFIQILEEDILPLTNPFSQPD